MSASATDPYAVLGLTPEVSDGELRQVYRELVKRHHPDHNGGSPESTARFAQIQDAYVRVARARGATVRSGLRVSAGPVADSAGEDPGIEQRIAELERELAAARAAQRKTPAPARSQAPAGSADAVPGRPTPQQLGHYETDDSLTSILDDAAAALRRRIERR